VKTMPDEGLYHKYDVFKNGELVRKRCFILIPENDPAACEALLAYAATTPNKQLCSDLIDWLIDIDPEFEERFEKYTGDFQLDNLTDWLTHNPEPENVTRFMRKFQK